MNKHACKYQKGFSLIELMIATALGIFLSAAMISLFVGSKQSYRLNENMSRLQENARFAVSFMSRDIRMTGYHACVTAIERDDAVSGQNNTGLNDSDTISVLWQSNACDVADVIVTTVYSIQTGANGGPALFRSVDGVSQELVEGLVRNWLKALKTCKFYMVKILIMTKFQTTLSTQQVSPIWHKQ